MGARSFVLLWVYLTFGWVIAAFMTSWAEAHCPPPGISITDGAIVALTYPALFPAVMIWGSIEKPKPVCTRVSP